MSKVDIVYITIILTLLIGLPLVHWIASLL